MPGGLTHDYVVFYKPFDVLCQFTGEPPSLGDFITIPHVYPVGRLDRDSEGLLVLTSDGALQHRLTDPKFAHPRTYLAQVEGIPSADVLEILRNGVDVRGGGSPYRSRPAGVLLLNRPPDLPPRDPPVRFRKSIPTSWLELTLTEGRNHQVRRMTAAVGYPTLRLVRVRSGILSLDGLKPGEWRYLTAGEVARLKAEPKRRKL